MLSFYCKQFFTKSAPMFKTESLELSHKSLITEACKKLAIPLSEYSFSNLYLFRKTHGYSLIHLDAHTYAVLGKSYKNQKFLMPLFMPDNWEKLVSFARQVGAAYIFPIPESWALSAEAKGNQISFFDEDSDYLYEVEKIATYAGRHLDGQRNAVRTLLSEHTVSCLAIDDCDPAELTKIVFEWEQTKGVEKSNEVACKEGINLLKELGLEGLAIEVDGKKEGFIIGEPLTPDTFVVHFAKTSRHIRGLYQYMYQELAKKLTTRFKWMNWEQDLGLEPLRHAKLEYHPTTLLKKGRLMI
jgi:uncharacterized protein